ncbi:DUF4236 domain-containing protein [Streptomyces sp. NPDC058371]|uniref:DUF4236 domain-containing protein n=1 Tax=Streptomyces sp. NPDC058371 TaxID=3346463 RepID=UPI0036539B17
MTVTFRKSIKILPGVRLNLGRKSVSVTVKVGPLSRTWSTTGRTTTSADLPGPLGYRRTTTRRSNRHGQ